MLQANAQFPSSLPACMRTQTGFLQALPRIGYSELNPSNALHNTGEVSLLAGRPNAVLVAPPTDRPGALRVMSRSSVCRRRCFVLSWACGGFHWPDDGDPDDHP